MSIVLVLMVAKRQLDLPAFLLTYHDNYSGLYSKNQYDVTSAVHMHGLYNSVYGDEPRRRVRTNVRSVYFEVIYSGVHSSQYTGGIFDVHKCSVSPSDTCWSLVGNGRGCCT